MVDIPNWSAAKRLFGEFRTALVATLSNWLFLVLGLPALVIGSHDAMVATITQIRWTGVLLALSGSFMLVAFVGLRRERSRMRWGPRVARPAAVLGAALSIYLAYDARLFFGWHSPRLLPWIASFVACVIARWRVTRSGTGQHLRDRQRDYLTRNRVLDYLTRNWLQVVGTLGVVPVVFNIAQTWYTNDYLPLQTNTYTLTQIVDLKDAGLEAANPDVHLLAATIAVKNTSSAEIMVTNGFYVLSGIRTLVVLQTRDAFAHDIRQNRRNGDLNTTWGIRYASSVLSIRSTFPGPFVLEPMQEISARFDIPLPEEVTVNFGYWSIRSYLSVSHKLVMGSPVSWTLSPCRDSERSQRYDECIVTEWEVQSPGWLWNVTKGRAVVDTLQEVQFGGLGGLPSDVALDDCASLQSLSNRVCSNSPRAENKQFGVGWQQTTTQVPVTGS